MNHYTPGPGPLDGSKKFRLIQTVKSLPKKTWGILTYPWNWYKEHRAIKKRDPFIYK
jgi:hypothetical protein